VYTRIIVPGDGGVHTEPPLVRIERNGPFEFDWKAFVVYRIVMNRLFWSF